MNARTSTTFLPNAAEYVSVRLQGTVWERLTPAHVLYRGLLGLGAALGRVGITANAMTYLSLVLAAGAGVAVALGAFGWAAALVVASGACDVLDGVIARASSTVSKYGALLDSTVDRLSDALPLLGLAVFYAGEPLLIAIPGLAVIGAFTVSYVRARAEALGARLPALFMRRAERIVLLTLSFLLGAVPCESAPFAAPLTAVGIAVLAILNVVGSVIVMRAANAALAPASLSESPASNAR